MKVELNHNQITRLALLIMAEVSALEKQIEKYREAGQGINPYNTWITEDEQRIAELNQLLQVLNDVYRLPEWRRS